ncbi:MAG: ATP-binding protein [Candidatus Gracilibacteria bacterium]|nr:ATP-binding protein [Candidatus Gracilibacteria bacterium]
MISSYDRRMHYKVTFPADYKNIPPLREMVYRIAILDEFDKKDAEHLKSVVDELCNNAIEWGSQPTSEVILEVYSDDKHMKITCRDQGHGNKLPSGEVLNKLDEEVQESAARGRGLRMIVRGFMDEITINDRKDGGLKIQTTLNKKHQTPNS